MVSQTRRWLADLERRRVTRTNRLGVWLAVLTCPCHAGWLLALTAGSAFGAALTPWATWLYAIFGTAFLFALWLMFKRDRADCPRCQD